MHAKTFFYLCIGIAAVGLVFSQLPPEVLLIVVVVVVVVLTTIFTDEEHLDRNNLSASQVAIAATTKAANPVPVGSSGELESQPSTAPTTETDEAKRIRLEAEEAATKGYLEQFTQPCPGCGIAVSKISNCNHMTCKFGLVIRFIFSLVNRFHAGPCGRDFTWVKGYVS
jgi:hypothetical protein